jgi:ParB/RepB/Spo0J family partition protein
MRGAMSSVEETFLEIPLEEIGESYAKLRLIHPQADARMMDSLRKFGQIFPVVVAKGERYELIDGFKRVRALKRLGHEHVTARVLDVSVHGQKAAMMDLNWKRGSISDLEEGMVLHSLCREDGLSQVEIAVLVGRHKSWVCRRLSLVERLCDEVLEHMRLGLIHTVLGRELCRLVAGEKPRRRASQHPEVSIQFQGECTSRLPFAGTAQVELAEPFEFSYRDPLRKSPGASTGENPHPHGRSSHEEAPGCERAPFIPSRPIR